MLARNRILVSGSGRIARRIAEELRAAGRPVGRVEDPDRLAAGLRSARTLILADPSTDPDALIGRTAVICERLPERRPPLRLILVRGPDTSAGSPVVPDGARLTLETFDAQVEAARALLARWPPHFGLDPAYGQVPHILLAGFQNPAPALLVQTMRLLHYAEAEPVITLADADPGARQERLLEAYPHAGNICRLRFADIEDIDLKDAPPVTSAYVCMESPEQGLATARRLAPRIANTQRVSPPILLEVGDVQPSGGTGDWDGQILPFSWLRTAFSPTILLDGRGDELARVVHEHYMDSVAAQGRDPNAEPSSRPWENLDTSYRNASRHQADHLDAKLATLDCRAVREELVESFIFAPLEAERLAIIEHQRWAADRYLDGWTYGPERDNRRKHHPQLVPYEDLSEPMKDLDRFAVRLTPTLLARSGRGLVRMLLVAVTEPQVECRTGRGLERLVGKMLERLTQRYPDRSLVMASTLESDASRLVVCRALDEYEAGLFLLCPRPLPDILAGLASERERGELLRLAARAERRISLAGEQELEVWTSARAKIRLLFGSAAQVGSDVKRVRIDPTSHRIEWSFEY
jgi:hypothetical protein